jgi:predicted DNA-binding transcriptional regulator YafY
MPNTGHVISLSDAIVSRRQVAIVHASASGGVTERTVDPYGLVYLNGLWYLPAYCHLRQDLRVFRLDRIRDVTALDPTFEPPASFDSLAFVQQSLAEMPSLWRVEVLLATTLGDARRRIAPFQATLEEVPSGVLLRANTEALEEFVRRLVATGIPFTVRAPDELRDALREMASELMRFAANEPVLMN